MCIMFQSLDFSLFLDEENSDMYSGVCAWARHAL